MRGRPTVEVPTGWKAIVEDWDCYRGMFGSRQSRAPRFLATVPSFCALALYRFGRWGLGRPGGRRRRLVLTLYSVLSQLTQRLTRVQIPLSAELGRHVWLGSAPPLIIAPGARVGAHCRMHGANTLGVGGRGETRGVPSLGEGVVLGIGAVVVGAVDIAPRTWIGSNSVVARSVSQPGSWIGVPVTRRQEPFGGVLPWLGEVRVSNDSCAAEPFWRYWRQDIERFFVSDQRLSAPRKLRICLTVDSIWAMAVYRMGRALRTRRLPPLPGRPLWWTYRWMEAWVGFLTGIRLDPDCRVGPGLYIGHFGPVSIGPGVRMGRDCNIGQMCAVAASGPEHSDAPILGDRVYLGVGSKVIGKVRVGNDVAVGANAVVLEDVPDRAVVVGNPATLVSYKGSADFIRVP